MGVYIYIYIFIYFQKCPSGQWLALPTSEILGSNSTVGRIQHECMALLSVSLSPFHCLNMTKIMLKGM